MTGNHEDALSELLSSKLIKHNGDNIKIKDEYRGILERKRKAMLKTTIPSLNVTKKIF